MTPAPSSPVPAVEAERPIRYTLQCPKCGFYSGDDWRQCKGSCPMPGSPHFDVTLVVVRCEICQKPMGSDAGVNDEHGMIAHAACYTPTPGRAAEPDTMGEVTKLVDDALSTAWDELPAPSSSRVTARARDALLSAARTIVTRAETAEAQLATQGWEDASSAPTDGTKFDAWVVHPDTGGFGHRIPDVQMRGDRSGFGYVQFAPDGVVWIYIDGSGDVSGLAPCRMTHWRRCPEQPLSTSGAD